ncbi:hypothetical protein ROE7235_02131 [Roseibaca ekhonensis]|jgi:hypothetical protein|uniref:GTP-binding protein Era n=1 Tax=Roseinatronobacter ekhonensis TaxID=254356 RepID=A0A3B0M8W1_9RHOB|nr:DUF1491 family protein [Roseibaca ekhonensis]SUZ32375.1 hypothetical protein ROE7235_02131 [Roseibaca ekhonensis]
MTEARLATGIWVSAYVRRLQLAGLPAYITAKGDDTAGAVLVKLALLDGTARAYLRRYDFERDARVWDVLCDGAETDVDAAISRQRSFDSDLWVIEVEDAKGRHLLEEDGLA